MGNIIVVEGKTDTVRLRNFFPDVTTIETNGAGINKTKLNSIKELSKHHQIIIFTDPDYPGQKIRMMVSELLNHQCRHAFLPPLPEGTGRKKYGVAEASDEELKWAFQNIQNFSNSDNSTLEWISYIQIVTSSSLRYKLCESYNLPFFNNKTFYKWLNYMQVNVQKLLLCVQRVNDEK